MPRFEVSWLIPVDADSPEQAAAAAWVAVHARDSCPVSIVTPMIDDLLRAGPPTLVETLPAGCWLPGYTLAELARINAGREDSILKAENP